MKEDKTDTSRKTSDLNKKVKKYYKTIPDDLVIARVTNIKTRYQRKIDDLARQQARVAEILKTAESNGIKVKLVPLRPYLRKKTQRPEELKLFTADKPYEFEYSIKDILEAITQGKAINGIQINEQIQDPNFRFTSTLEPELGTALSETLSAVVIKAQKFHHSLAGKKGSAVTNEMRNKKVDEYAANMYQIINGMKEEAGVKSIRATVDLLTKNKVIPPSGKEWNIAAVQDLQKRWKSLGLLSSPDPK